LETCVGDEIRVKVILIDDTGRIKLSRKQALREQVVRGGPDAIDIALADKIASLRHALTTDTPLAKRKVAHYGMTVAMSADARHPDLARQAEALLAAYSAGRDGSAPVG